VQYSDARHTACAENGFLRTQGSRPQLLGEKIMERRFDTRAAPRSRAGRRRWLPGTADAVLDGEAQVRAPVPVIGFDSGATSRLPPPRAARTPRSRGFFLQATQAPEKQEHKSRKRDVSIVGFAVAVVALTSALIVGAPAAIESSAESFNPGPAMVAATSVAPAFIAASKPD
jgi:hypothetical protein